MKGQAEEMKAGCRAGVCLGKVRQGAMMEVETSEERRRASERTLGVPEEVQTREEPAVAVAVRGEQGVCSFGMRHRARGRAEEAQWG